MCFARRVLGTDRCLGRCLLQNSRTINVNLRPCTQAAYPVIWGPLITGIGLGYLYN